MGPDTACNREPGKGGCLKQIIRAVKGSLRTHSLGICSRCISQFTRAKFNACSSSQCCEQGNWCSATHRATLTVLWWRFRGAGLGACVCRGRLRRLAATSTAGGGASQIEDGSQMPLVNVCQNKRGSNYIEVPRMSLDSGELWQRIVIRTESLFQHICYASPVPTPM